MRVSAGDDVAAIVRSAEGEAVTLVIDGGADPLALATMLASVAPLAIERAPGVRVNAVVAEDGADEANVAAAVAFLDAACSITGQVLRIA